MSSMAGNAVPTRLCRADLPLRLILRGTIGAGNAEASKPLLAVARVRDLAGGRSPWASSPTRAFGDGSAAPSSSIVSTGEAGTSEVRRPSVAPRLGIGSAAGRAELNSDRRPAIPPPPRRMPPYMRGAGGVRSFFALALKDCTSTSSLTSFRELRGVDPPSSARGVFGGRAFVADCFMYVPGVSTVLRALLPPVRGLPKPTPPGVFAASSAAAAAEATGGWATAALGSDGDTIGERFSESEPGV